MAVTEERLSELKTSEGRLLTVTGPVIEVEFPPEPLPEINFALTVERTIAGKTDTITAEVSQHVGHSIVKAICMKNTDGLVRGTTVINTGAPITVPVGRRRSATSTTCSASRSTARRFPTTSSAGRSTAAS